MGSVTGHLFEQAKLITFWGDIADSPTGKQNGVKDISLLILCVH